MRIIAGQYRGRLLRAPKGSSTRPTTDRVREALFGILGDLRDCRVVDCYAGTGALGLEALSRGAAHAVFVESGDAAARVLAANIASLDVQARATLLKLPVERSARRIGELAPFDLVLADPPWPIAGRAARAVVSTFRDHVSSAGILVLGHPKREPLAIDPETGVELIDRRSWGDSAMSWYRVVPG